MSYTIENATNLHDRQVAAVSAVQSLVVKAVETLSGLTSLAPESFEKLSNTLGSTLGEVTAPLAKAVGTPTEVRAYAVASSRDWLEVQHRFQTALLDVIAPSTEDAKAPKQTAKKS